MPLQKAARRTRIHSVLMLNAWDELCRKGGTPRPVVHGVSKLMRARGTALIEQHPNHLRHVSLLHAVVENGCVALSQSWQCASKAVGEIHRRVAVPWMSRISRGQEHPSTYVHLAAPVAG